MQFSYRNIIFIIFVCFFISLISIVRNDFGIDPDYQAYKHLYTIIDKVRFDEIEEINDRGFLIFIFFAKTLDISFDFFLWFVCFSSLMIKVFCVAKKSPESTVYFILFYSMTFFLLHELVQVRIAIAISLFYLVLNFSMFDTWKNRFVYLFIGIIAASFHLSVGFLFFIPIIKVRLRLFLACLLFFVFVVNNSLFYGNLSEYLSNYSNVGIDIISYLNELNGSTDNLSILNSANLFTFMFLILSLCLHNKMEVTDAEQYVLDLNIKFLMFSLVLFFLFSNSPVVAYRMSELFRVLIPIASGIMLASMYGKPRFSLVLIFILAINVGFFVNYLKAVLVF